jgi:hypothetical protein
MLGVSILPQRSTFWQRTPGNGRQPACRVICAAPSDNALVQLPDARRQIRDLHEDGRDRLAGKAARDWVGSCAITIAKRREGRGASDEVFDHTPARACPLGGLEQAKAISLASFSPSKTRATAGVARCLRLNTASKPSSTNCLRTR